MRTIPCDTGGSGATQANYFSNHSMRPDFPVIFFFLIAKQPTPPHTHALLMGALTQGWYDVGPAS